MNTTFKTLSNKTFNFNQIKIPESSDPAHTENLPINHSSSKKKPSLVNGKSCSHIPKESINRNYNIL